MKELTVVGWSVKELTVVGWSVNCDPQTLQVQHVLGLLFAGAGYFVVRLSGLRRGDLVALPCVEQRQPDKA